MSVTPTTWNSADKHASLVLSNGDKTVTCSVGEFENLRSVFGASTGAFYVEATFDQVGAGIENVSSIGLATSGVALNAQPYASAEAWILQDENSGAVCIKYHNSVIGNLDLPAIVSGNIAMLAFNLDAHKLWFGRQGTWADGGNSSAGTGAQYTNLSGTLYLLGCFRGQTPDAILTINCGASAFAYSVPTGFQAGFGEIGPDRRRHPIFWL